MAIGIFGGAFNPPHKEHIRIARSAMKELGLDGIVFVPSGNSPHKNLTVPYSLRKKMLMSYFLPSDNFSVNDIEHTMQGKAYSLDVLKAMKAQYGDIVFLMGGDSLLHFNTWHLPQEIVKVCPIAVIPRGRIIDEVKAETQKYNEFWNSDIMVLDTVGEDMSSSVIRAKAQMGCDLSAELNDCCINTINTYGLYTEYSGVAKKMQRKLPERWAHISGVVLCGLKINEQTALPVEKVFLGCLLHDCMKHANVVHAGVPLDTIGTPVMHAFNGAAEARINYGITDEDILNSICYHTTGRAGMSTLEKLVFTADMVEENRDFEGVEQLREAVYTDFEAGFRACLAKSYNGLLSSGKKVYYLTEDCYNYYCKGGE